MRNSRAGDPIMSRLSINEFQDKYRNLQMVGSIRKEMLKEIIDDVAKKDLRKFIRGKRDNKKYFDMKFK